MSEASTVENIPGAGTRRLAIHEDLATHVVGDPAGLHFRFLPGGHLHSVRHGEDLLVNLVFGCPLAGSLQRLYVQLETGQGRRVLPVIAPEAAAEFRAAERSAEWKVASGECVAIAALVPDRTGWSLQVRVDNKQTEPVRWRVLYGIDVGLAAPGAARNNESYTSQYIDHRALDHPEFGAVVASRQNLPVDGAHPFLLQACLDGCDDFATDARDVFGAPHERPEHPACLRADASPLPGLRQGESSYVALLSRWQTLAAAEEGSCSFAGVFVADHADPSSDADLALLPSGRPEMPGVDGPAETKRSMLHAPDVAHGEELDEAALRALAPGEWDVVERSPKGVPWSFFTGDDARHVVTRAKEEASARSHATILRSGAGDYPSADQLTTTCFASGVFNSLLSCGHVSFHRLLSFPRESCGLHASAGQRIWIRADDGHWQMLGVPSFFEMGLNHARWFYKLGERAIEVRVEVDGDRSLCRLHARVVAGGPTVFLLTHGLVGGVNEYDARAELEIEAGNALARVRAEPGNLYRKCDPQAGFTVRAVDAAEVTQIGGAELLEGGEHAHALLVMWTRAVTSFTVEIEGGTGAQGDGREWEAKWAGMAGSLRLRGGDAETVARLDRVLPWFVHNGMVHLTVPHGVEQYNGGAWGSRDVTQGSVELLLALGSDDSCRRILLETYQHQFFGLHHWPQWFMLEPFGHIQQAHSHGDIPLWPLKALCDYLEATSDFSILDEEVPWTVPEDGSLTETTSPLLAHVVTNLDWLRRNCLPGTALLRYGDGDWNDSLQPAKPELRERLVSSWSVALCYQVVRRLEEVMAKSGRELPGLDGFADEIARDFRRFLVIDGTVCGFFLFDEGSSETGRPLLHPADDLTGIHYRLLPMTRSMIGGLFDAGEAAHHEELIREHLLAADGARLMDRPPAYRGGVSEIFQRAESSPCFSREIGIMYTHAHLRYIEAMARLGKAEAMLEGFGMANPVGISASVPHALARQGNAYFSSSDAAVATRYEAADRYEDIKAGKVPVDGGWRIYSSGPGIFVSLVLTRMVGLRRHYDRVILDPVVPRSLDGLEVDLPWAGKPLRIVFAVKDGEHTPKTAILNGEPLEALGEEANPYRSGGWELDAAGFDALLVDGKNTLKVSL